MNRHNKISIAKTLQYCNTNNRKKQILRNTSGTEFVDLRQTLTLVFQSAEY